MNADPIAFVSGGCFLSKRVSHPQGISDFVPDSILKLSTCFIDIARDSWADKAYH
jgi:hypothetical protein